MPTAAKKTTAKKTAAAPRLQSTPLVDLTADAFDADAVEQVHLFSLGGVDYTIPAQSSALVLIEYVRIEDDKGGDAPMWWLFDQLLGPEGVEALLSYQGLTREHIRKLHVACLDTIRGPKG